MPVQPSRFNLHEVAEIANTAWRAGERMSFAVALHYDISERYANAVIARARKVTPVPYDRPDKIEVNVDMVPRVEYVLMANPEPWVSQAECLHLPKEMFFPDRGGDTATAKAVCAGCPVADDCLDYALRTHQTFGIWGGRSERERRGMRRKNREDRAAFYRELIA